MKTVTKALGLGGVAVVAAAVSYSLLVTESEIKSDADVAVASGSTAFSLSDLINRLNSFENINSVPMFKVEAIGFKAVDESGVDLLGSDEVVAVWHASNSVGANTYEYGSVDSGQSRTFLQGQSCIYPINSNRFINGNAVGSDGRYNGWGCVEGGGVGPIFFRAHLYEMDSGWTQIFPCFDGNVETAISTCQDDHLGGYSVTLSVRELVEVLPTEGTSKEFTVQMDACLEALIGNVCSSFGNPPNYDFSYRITRLTNLEIPLKAIDN